MKIFLVNRRIGCAAAAPGVDDAPVLLYPDTALTPKGMPVFLPDYCRPGWELRSVVAYRIGRLGKSIDERFAARYVDGMTAGAVLMPGGGLTGNSVTDYGFDSSLTLGDYTAPVPVAECRFGQELFEAADCAIETLVARLSLRFTLRTGDIIVAGLGPAAVEAVIGARVEMALNGRELRPVRVK